MVNKPVQPASEEKEEEPAFALPSSTVVMLRDCSGAPELLAVKRRAGDAFGESYAFPGGVVDDDEDLAHEFFTPAQSSAANKRLGVDNGLSYYSAAVRELFEETGILLVTERSDLTHAQFANIQGYRNKVDRGEIPWTSFLRQCALSLSSDVLHYFAHWVTPDEFPKRWSTRFFLARMPADQVATQCGNELTDICWMNAADILAASGNGDMQLPYPTMRILQDFRKMSTIDEMLEWADCKAVELTKTIKIRHEGKTRLVIKGDPGYPEDD